MLYLLALFIGIVSGLRAMTAPAAISWVAWLGLLDLSGSWLSFLASPWAVGILSVLALAELVTDQLPSTPSRKVPPQFGARIVMGAVCGAAIGLPSGFWTAGLVLGIAGAVVGTLGGAAVRQRLAERFGRDRPAGLIEDAVAILAAAAIVWSL